MIDNEYDNIEFLYKRKKALMEEVDKCYEEINKNINYIAYLEHHNEYTSKKQGKLLKTLEKVEIEYEKIKNTVIKFSKLKNTISEDAFEEIKEQLKIRKNDLKNQVKNLKQKVEFSDNTSKNADCIFAATECLEKRIEILRKEIAEIDVRIQYQEDLKRQGV